MTSDTVIIEDKAADLQKLQEISELLQSQGAAGAPGNSKTFEPQTFHH